MFYKLLPNYGVTTHVNSKNSKRAQNLTFLHLKCRLGIVVRV